ncbi:hypothetical protein ACFSS8_02020 [Paracoccus kondratievae]
MSLMKSLARVAAGVMLAKGIGTMMKNAQNRPQSGGGRSSGGLLDELLAATPVGRAAAAPARAGLAICWVRCWAVVQAAARPMVARIPPLGRDGTGRAGWPA